MIQVLMNPQTIFLFIVECLGAGCKSLFRAHYCWGTTE